MLKQLKMYYLVVGLPFALLLLGASIFSDAIMKTITRNPHPQINYTIFVIILVGGSIILINTRRLIREARVLVEFFGAMHAKVVLATLQKMANGYAGDTACLLQMVVASSGRSISHQEQVAIEHELTNARARLVRRNALPQYLTGLLVGMGLLGTFIGLLATLNDISVLISSFADLDMQNASPLLVFRTMIERMKAPMQSMGIAFSASMFGLLGSIILGLMMVGLRRLQGDIFSLLSSEIARHIEIALSHESIACSSVGEGSGDLAKVLIRIEERYAEAARSQQRALSAVISDLHQQRAEMLSALAAQAEAGNSFRAELQQLVRLFGSMLHVMEKGNAEVSAQISEMKVQAAGESKEAHKLLAQQLDEQKKLRDALDSYKIEEWMAEAARSQNRMLSAVVNDLEQQRSEMVRALAEQTEANNSSRGELKVLGGHLVNISDAIAKGNEAVSSQISELTIQVAVGAKEADIRSGELNAEVRTDLQQLGGQLRTNVEALEKGNAEVCVKIADLTAQVAAGAKESHRLLESNGTSTRAELQQLGLQLGTNFKDMGKGNEEICALISQMMNRSATDARELHALFAEAGTSIRNDLQLLNGQLGTHLNLTEKGTDAICALISEMMAKVAAAAKESHGLLDCAGSNFRTELRQIGGQLGTVVEKGNDEICTRISELMIRMSAETRDSQELPSMQMDQQLTPGNLSAGAPE